MNALVARKGKCNIAAFDNDCGLGGMCCPKARQPSG
jgi:hypothetical protein